MVLIAALTVVLIFSTSFEAAYGTGFAQRVFYRAQWFDLLLGLLGLKRHVCGALGASPGVAATSFPADPLGIVVLLAGAMLARIYGLEGQLRVSEGQTPIASRAESTS